MRLLAEVVEMIKGREARWLREDEVLGGSRGPKRGEAGR